MSLDSAVSYVLPLLFLGFGALLLFSKAQYFDAFLCGARDGLKTAVQLLPTLLALIVGVAMLRASGALELLADALTPLCERIGLPADLVPLILVRPVSGSASTAVLNGIFTDCGPDSLSGLMASVMLGSSETMIYVTSVYYGAVGIRRTRHTLLCAGLVMIFSIFFSVLLCRILFQ